MMGASWPFLLSKEFPYRTSRLLPQSVFILCRLRNLTSYSDGTMHCFTMEQESL